MDSCYLMGNWKTRSKLNFKLTSLINLSVFRNNITRFLKLSLDNTILFKIKEKMLIGLLTS